MNYLKIAALIGVILFICDQIGLWMERKGWVYWRHKKPSTRGGIGNSLQELNAILNPSVRHVIEVKQKDGIKKGAHGNDKDRPVK